MLLVILYFNMDHIYHMASIASPVFYRRYPIETMDANIWGLRRVLDLCCEKPIRGLVFFSGSEIYGDPAPENIPTPETYRGNVDCQGPRACYDEAKRFGETMCYLFHQKYNMPITIRSLIKLAVCLRTIRGWMSNGVCVTFWSISKRARRGN